MTTAPLWPWLMLVGLGAYHGINPAMGWLFAVALGLHRNRRAVVLWALVPLALGHATAIAATIAAVAGLGLMLDADVVRIAAGIALVGWGVCHLVGRHGHRARVGMRAGSLGLAMWSCLMGLAHGAGLMLVPVFTEWPAERAGGHAGMLGVESAPTALAAIGVHTLAMIAVTGLVAVLVYEWVGVGILRRGWVNLDWLWAAALVIAGGVLLVA